MKISTSSRILAALMSATVTLAVLDSVALYGLPAPAQPESLIAGNTPTLVASASEYASYTDSIQ